MPKLEYPAVFENGLVGVRCKEEIKHREAYMYVPFKMMLSIKKTQYHEILGPIILDHPNVFETDQNEDWE